MLTASRTERLGMVAALAIIAVMIPSCIVVEHLTGLSPTAQEPSYAIRRGAGVVAFIVLGFIVWGLASRERAAVRAELVRRRDEFARGKVCISCGRSLSLDRLHHPYAGDEEMTGHWMNVCPCGQLTVFDESGQGHRVEGPPPPD